MTWWLSLSPGELREATTCRDCGGPGADIDLGQCFDCFDDARGCDPALEAEYEREMCRQYEEWCAEQFRHYVILESANVDCREVKP